MLTFVVTLVLLWNLWIVPTVHFSFFCWICQGWTSTAEWASTTNHTFFSVDCHMEVSSLWCNNICKWTTMFWPDRTRFNQLTPDCGCLPPKLHTFNTKFQHCAKREALLTARAWRHLNEMKWIFIVLHSFIYFYQTDVNFRKCGLLWVKGNNEHSSDVFEYFFFALWKSTFHQ